MTQNDVNKRAEIIRNSVSHSFPYNKMIPNFEGPHSEDCEGCLINAEVEILVAELNRLSPVEKIIEELEHEKKLRKLLSKEQHLAYEKAGVDEKGSIADLVSILVEDRNRLDNLLQIINNDLNILQIKLKTQTDWTPPDVC